MTTLLRHIFSLTQLPTPPPPKSSQQQQQQQQQQHQHQQEQHQQEPQQQSPHSKASRRNAIFFLSFLSLTQTPKACSAFSFGIPGPKEWLKDQKKKTSKFLLAPIDASRESLRSASVLLRTTPESSTKDLGEEVQKLLKSAARDCVLEDRNSFVSFQAQTGVEVCTFSLILKNASSLLDDRNPIKLETEAILGDLVRSFTFLNGELSTSDLQLPSDRQKVEDMLTDTISSLKKFEEGVKNCLDA
ncbi:Chloroplast thylakoid membrane [Cinnamomum micranthum f. kanehirae]|uniref:Chloroplast thylakoid membrane n=1 Tax=Cinnamomum micranthum f. kanehirae TaxID=337451 RepID=A0A443N1J6_9MAGN|nr:Chloroplast thylakoid membrane [Cinnamomum micranthum f. kanehirae]